MSYITSHKQQLLDSIENQVLYANIGCVLVGSEGIGKSFTLEQIRSRVRSEVFTSEIIAEPVMTQAQIEKTMCLQLGLSWQDSDSNITQKISENSERRTLLTIDDAHLLSPACLEFIVSLINEQVSKKDCTLFVILAGDVSLAKNLNETPSLRANPNLCALFELEPFDKQETTSLVADFQNTDEATVEAIYDKQKLEYFWQLSDGIPGKLEYQIRRWLEQEDSSDGSSPRSNFGYLSAVGYGVVAVLLIVALLYQKQINNLISPEKQPIVANTQLAKNKFKAVQNNDAEDSKKVLVKKPGESKSELKTKTVVAENKVNGSKSIANDKSVDSKKTVHAQEAKAEVSNAEVSKAKELENANVEVKSELGSRNKDVSNVGLKNEMKDTSDADRNKSSSNDSSELSEDERYLLSLKGETFTLQWIGVSEYKSAVGFKNKHPLSNQMKIFKRRSSEKTLYLVVSGSFNSKLDASNARLIYQQRNYPGKPWIKSLAAIQKEIKP